MLRSVLLLALAFCALRAPSASAQGLGPLPVPGGNPITPEKAQLGKALFWDEQMSSTGTMACGSCHVPGAGGTDPRPFGAVPGHPGFDGIFGTPDDIAGSAGVVLHDAAGRYYPDAVFGMAPQFTPRRSMTVINAAYTPRLFWDGRALEVFRDPQTKLIILYESAALESQIAEPPVSHAEMGFSGRSWNDVVARLAAAEPLALASDVPASLEAWIAGRSYPDLFEEVFGTRQLSPALVAMAIATYERTLISDAAPVDTFLAGDLSALTPQEQLGLDVFNGGEALCFACHTVGLFTDDDFHSTGVRPLAEDLGLGFITRRKFDAGRFKTPSLRNLELRAPYFHDGSAQTVEEVVDFYVRGGDFISPNHSPLVRPLALTQQEIDALTAFLKRPMNDPRVAGELPPFDRPTLFTETNRPPVLFGAGTPGSGGAAPAMVALEPPALGNPGMTVAVHQALGGAQAALLLDRAVEPGGRPFRGATLYLGLGPALRVLRTDPLAGVGPGGGYGSIPLRVPADAALAGVQVAAQWLVADPGAPQGFAASEAAGFTLF